jgi:surface protein
MSWKYWSNKKGDRRFIFTVNPANTSTGSSSSNQFKLPLSSLAGTNYNFTVDWGDGTSDNITTWNQAETTHTYPDSTPRTIIISGLIRGFNFMNTGDRLKITNISNWGSVEFVPVTLAFGAFWGCSNLNVTATDAPTFLNGEQQGFFRLCSSLTGNSSFDDWNLSPCTGLVRFFDGCTLFNQNINNWNVSNCNNFDSMFFNMANYNQPMNNWNVSAGTIFNQVFRSCTAFNQNIGNWNLSNATTCISMFHSATNFNNGGSDSIKDWNVSNVSTFCSTNNGMFRLATAFNQPIGSWNVGNGTNFDSFFRNANAFNQNIGSWNVSKSANFTNFMAGKTNDNYSAANLDAIYNGWSARTFINTGLTISFGTIKYTAAGTAGRNILTSAPNNWSITDGGI